MGLFSSKKVFTTEQQIKDTLYKIRTLDYKERARVFDVLKKELDDGGVSEYELREVVRKLRLNKEISEIDKKNLLELI